MVWQLFVYGTLRPGMSNVHRAHQAGLTVAHQATVSGVDLYHLEPEGYPAVVPGAGTVVGEVLSLSGSTEPLDRLEGMFLEPPLYRRERIVPDGWAVYVWIYTLRTTGAPAVAWSQLDSSRQLEGIPKGT